MKLRRPIAVMLCLLALAPLGTTASEPGAWRFVFGREALANATRVTPEMNFTAERGFGFEPGSAPMPQEAFVTSDQPLRFSVTVPEGNYRVIATVPPAASPLTVKSESRRLMIESSPAARVEFIVNVRNAKVPPPPLNAPGNDHVELNNRENSPANGLVYHWDDKLTLEFNGPHPALAALEIVAAPELPTVFLAGDSTVTDQPREPGASWGQMLPRFFKPTVAVANHAESGETLKSFITELRLDKILSQVKRGDWLFLQFSHNDQKQSWPQTYVEAGTTYKAYLRVFIAEARRRGVTPVLVTPMQRRQFDEAGKIRNSHGDYPAAMREVAREENVALVDLERASVAFYEALGPEKSPLAFSGGGRDPTHHNNYGAYELAQCIVAGIRAAKLDLAAHIVDDFSGFDPARPDAPEKFSLPASPGRTTQAPRGN